MESDIYVQFPPTSDVPGTESEKLWPVPASPSKTQDKQLVVVLLGWAGAEHKYLAKYSDFYWKRGCIIIRYITPLRYHIIENHKLPLLAHKVLKFLTDLQLDSHPIFFHVFSNGGAYTYSYILRELAKRPQSSQLDIKGTIFDSAPCPRKLQKSYVAMLSIFANLKIFKYAAASLVIFLLVCQIFWFHLKSAVKFCIYGDSLDSLENRDADSAPLTNWLGKIANVQNHNFLFLYSDSDSLIPSDQIERFADIVASRGSRVEKVKFTGSEHVMHYRRYPQEYLKAITDFVRSVMAKQKGKAVITDDM